MTFEEALQACANGTMPKVQTADGYDAQVTVIKNHNGHKGVEVVIPPDKLPEWKRVRWYWASDETDKRRHYMRDLTLIP